MGGGCLLPQIPKQDPGLHGRWGWVWGRVQSRGVHNAINSLAIWLGDRGGSRLAASAARSRGGEWWRGGPVLRDRRPDGQAPAWVWAEASELPVVRANQLWEVAGRGRGGPGGKPAPPPPPPPEGQERQKSRRLSRDPRQAGRSRAPGRPSRAARPQVPRPRKDKHVSPAPSQTCMQN